MKKGFFFTMDAIIAVMLLGVAFSIVLSIEPTTISGKSNYEQMHYVTEDAMQIFSKLKFSDINETLKDEIIANTNITEEDLGQGLPDIIGLLWAYNETGYAEDLIIDVFSEPGSLIPSGYNYALSVEETDNKTLIYSTTGNDPEDEEELNYLTSASRIVSGYKENTAPFGFVARAWATKFKKSNTLIVMGDVITSSVRKQWGGNNQNKVNITYIVDISDDANITDAYWFIEAAWTDTKFKAYINGVYVPGSDSSGNKLLSNLKDYFHRGRNYCNVVYRYGSGGYDGGDDGATHIVVTYNTSEINTLNQHNKFYFQDVKSNASIKYKKPIFSLSEINSMSVHMNYTESTSVSESTLYFIYNGNTTTISTKSISNGTVDWNNTEIESVLTAAGINYSSLDGRYFWFMVDVDEYHSRENLGYGRRIYGNDSYIQLTYSSVDSIIYNYIDISKPVQNYSYSNQYLIADFYKNIHWNFTLRDTIIPLMAKFQFAWLYLSGSDPSQQAVANGIPLYNHDPLNASSNPLIKEFARFGYDTNPSGILVNSTNTFDLSFSNGYAVNPHNSLGEYTFLIPGSVGYGETFETRQNATDDAINRLKTMLGEYVDAEDITIEAPLYSSKMPWMYGPALITLQVWR